MVFVSAPDSMSTYCAEVPRFFVGASNQGAFSFIVKYSQRLVASSTRDTICVFILLGHTTLDTGQTLQQPINNIHWRWRAMTFLVTYCDYFSFFSWCLLNVLTKYVAVGQLAGRGCSSKEKLYREHCEVHEMDGLIEKFCYCSFNLCNTANNRIDKVTLTTVTAQCWFCAIVLRFWERRCKMLHWQCPRTHLPLHPPVCSGK